MVASIEEDHRHIAHALPAPGAPPPCLPPESCWLRRIFFRTGGRDLFLHQGSRRGDFLLRILIGFLPLSARRTRSIACVGSSANPANGSKTSAAESWAIETSAGKSSRPSASIRTTTPICNNCCNRCRFARTGAHHFHAWLRAVRFRACAAAPGCGWRWRPRCSRPGRPLRHLTDHSGGYGRVRYGVDQDEASGVAVGVIGVQKQRTSGLHFHHADAVELERCGRLGIERLHVHAMLDGRYPGLDRLRGMLQQVALARIERLGIHPDQGGGESSPPPPAAGGRPRASLPG